jgi:phospholipid transport system substrate-binding protein
MISVRALILLRLCALFGLGWLAASAAAEGLAEPQQVIRDTSQRLRTILLEDRQQLTDDPTYLYRLADEVFLPHVDMGRVSSLVLGKHWRKATPAQKRAFAEQFKHMLVRTYATALRELGDWEIRFLPLRMQPGEKRVVVQTMVSRPGGPPVAIDYRMYLSDDSWRAYDVKIEGISLITNYRSNFASLIRQKGIGGLIEELDARNRDSMFSSGKPLAANMAAR